MQRRNDVIVGGKGVNQATGNGGADTFVLTTGQGHTIIKDFNINVDTIKIEVEPSGISLEIVGGNIEIGIGNDLMAIVIGRSDIPMMSDSLLF